MSYMALYRKFRPQTFEQVKGQDHVVRTLKNQIINNRIGHAYLFTGTRGTGKTSVAKLFARAINCLEPKDGDPCNCCEVCFAAAKDNFMDIVEIDAASNTGVDDIRRIIEEVRYTPVKGRYKVYIIDEVHMLSGSAFNAFLKTLEEPPSYVVFILATTEPHKLPITILSRCQRYDFHRIGSDIITSNLKELTDKEGVSAEDKALEYIARMGDGSMRDSISLLDKCISFSLGDKLTYESVLQTLGTVDVEVFSRLFRAVFSSDAVAALKELEKASFEGKDISQFVSDFVWYLRNLLLINVGGDPGADLIGVSGDNIDILKSDAVVCDASVLMRYIKILSELLGEMRVSSSRQILTEVAFIKLARPQMETDNQSLADRVRQIEAGMASSAVSSQPKSDAVSDNSGPEHYYVPEYDDSYIMGTDSVEEVIEPEYHFEEPFAEPEEKIVRMGTVASSWGDIISACEGRILKMVLKKSEPGEEDDSGVTVYSPEGVNLDAIKREIKEVESLIEKVTGRKLSVIVKPLGSKGPERNQPVSDVREPSREFPEDLLKNINFDIGTEET